MDETRIEYLTTMLVLAVIATLVWIYWEEVVYYATQAFLLIRAFLALALFVFGMRILSFGQDVK